MILSYSQNLKNQKKKSIQERMIHMNKCDEIIVYPRKNVTNALRGKS